MFVDLSTLSQLLAAFSHFRCFFFRLNQLQLHSAKQG
jgi:hypothetical protein